MNFDAVCEQLNLGKLTEQPVRLYGGLMHKMYRLTTTNGVYAVKHLNPHVMAREDALANFRRGEALERKLERTDLPLLPALTIGGRKMQEVEGDFFYVFPYFEGEALKDEDITPGHCEIAGGLLAQLHAVENIHAPVEKEMLTFDWDGFDLSEEDRALLWHMQTAANAATLPPRLTICHNDLDPKNILWNGMDCRIIDLECLNYGSPYLELLEIALCWAGYESGEVDFERFSAFVGAYAAAGGDLAADWAAVCAANAGRLAWLHYNLCRAGGTEGEENRELGKAEVKKTVACIRGYARMKEDIVQTMEDIHKLLLEEKLARRKP